MKKYYFTFLFLLLTLMLNAQYFDGFSQNDSLYIEELQLLFGQRLTDEEEEVFEQFSERWDSLDVSHKKDIMIISSHTQLRIT